MTDIRKLKIILLDGVEWDENDIGILYICQLERLNYLNRSISLLEFLLRDHLFYQDRILIDH